LETDNETSVFYWTILNSQKTTQSTYSTFTKQPVQSTLRSCWVVPTTRTLSYYWQ